MMSMVFCAQQNYSEQTFIMHALALLYLISEPIHDSTIGLALIIHSINYYMNLT